MIRIGNSYLSTRNLKYITHSDRVISWGYWGDNERYSEIFKYEKEAIELIDALQYFQEIINKDYLKEEIQWYPQDLDEIDLFLNGYEALEGSAFAMGDKFFLPTEFGMDILDKGDWIVKDGDFYKKETTKEKADKILNSNKINYWKIALLNLKTIKTVKKDIRMSVEFWIRGGTEVGEWMHSKYVIIHSNPEGVYITPTI